MIISSAHQPHHRTVLAVDIEGSTARNDRAKARLRESLYDLVGAALRVGGIGPHRRDPFVDRGDGLLTLVHPADEVPKTLLLSSVVPLLDRLLTDHNDRYPADRFRVRAVVHAGEVCYDRRGPFGEAIDVACRLLDAVEVKRALRQTATPLVLVISGDLYLSVVRHGYDGVDPRTFTPLVNLRMSNVWQCGWLHVPGHHAVERSAC